VSLSAARPEVTTSKFFPLQHARRLLVFVAATLLLVHGTGATTLGFVLIVIFRRKSFRKHNSNLEPLGRNSGVSFKNSCPSFGISFTDQWFATCWSRRCHVSAAELTIKSTLCTKLSL
jgi:hypothetical protein